MLDPAYAKFIKYAVVEVHQCIILVTVWFLTQTMAMVVAMTFTTPSTTAGEAPRNPDSRKISAVKLSKFECPVSCWNTAKAVVTNRGILHSVTSSLRLPFVSESLHSISQSSVSTSTCCADSKARLAYGVLLKRVSNLRQNQKLRKGLTYTPAYQDLRVPFDHRHLQKTTKNQK